MNKRKTRIGPSDFHVTPTRFWPKILHTNTPRPKHTVFCTQNSQNGLITSSHRSVVCYFSCLFFVYLIHAVLHCSIVLSTFNHYCLFYPLTRTPHQNTPHERQGVNYSNSSVFDIRIHYLTDCIHVVCLVSLYCSRSIIFSIWPFPPYPAPKYSTRSIFTPLWSMWTTRCELHCSYLIVSMYYRITTVSYSCRFVLFDFIVHVQSLLCVFWPFSPYSTPSKIPHTEFLPCCGVWTK